MGEIQQHLVYGVHVICRALCEEFCILEGVTCLVAVMVKVSVEAKGSVGCSGRTKCLGGENYESAASDKTLGNLPN